MKVYTIRFISKQLPASLQIPKTKETDIDHLWVGVQKNVALKKMVRHGDAAQAKLQARILSLDAEAGVYDTIYKRI